MNNKSKYGIAWYERKQYLLYENQIVREEIKRYEVPMYYFMVIDNSGLQFAKVDFWSEGDTSCFASTEIVEFENGTVDTSNLTRFS